LFVLFLAQGASGWLGVRPRCCGVHTLRAAATQLASGPIARQMPKRGAAQVRAGATSVRSMILGETPVIEATGINR